MAAESGWRTWSSCGSMGATGCEAERSSWSSCSWARAVGCGRHRHGGRGSASSMDFRIADFDVGLLEVVIGMLGGVLHRRRETSCWRTSAFSSRRWFLRGRGRRGAVAQLGGPPPYPQLQGAGGVRQGLPPLVPQFGSEATPLSRSSAECSLAVGQLQQHGRRWLRGRVVGVVVVLLGQGGSSWLARFPCVENSVRGSSVVIATGWWLHVIATGWCCASWMSCLPLVGGLRA